MVISIVGGSGFIGTELARQFLAEGHAPRIVDKKISECYPELCRIADVRDIASLRTALEGAEVCINLAAEHKDNVVPRSLYWDVNVKGARNICAVAEQLAIRKIVFTSSVAVYGLAKVETAENGEPRPFNAYGLTKLEAESVYKEWRARSPERMLVIVRPTVVFGPRNRGNVYNLLRQMASGKFLMVGTGRNIKSMAFIENVAAFLRRTIGLQAGCHIFNYVDKPDLNMNKLIRVVKDCMGRRGGISLTIPYPIAYAAGLGLDVVSHLMGREFAISAVRVKKFCSSTHFSSMHLDTTGFKAPVSLLEGIRRTVNYEFRNVRQNERAGGVVFDSE